MSSKKSSVPKSTSKQTQPQKVQVKAQPKQGVKTVVKQSKPTVASSSTLVGRNHAAVTALGQYGPEMIAMANDLYKQSHKKKEKKHHGGGLGGFLKGAAKTAAAIAPSLLELAPALLLSHPPSRMAAAAGGAAMPPIVGDTGIATAFGGIGNMIGIHEQTPLKSKGIVHGTHVRGVDKLVDVNVTNATEGELLASVSLNPLDSTWANTRVHLIAKGYNRYRIKNLAMMYIPTVPTTQAGSMILFCLPDPTEKYTGSGLDGTKIASAQDESETAQVWESLMTEWTGDHRQEFFSNVTGQEPRLTTPGSINVVSNSDITFTGTLGSLYCVYDLEFHVPTVTGISELQWTSYNATSAPTGATLAMPFGTPSGATGWDNWTVNSLAGDVTLVSSGGIMLSVDDTSSPTANVIKNFTPGYIYYIEYGFEAATTNGLLNVPTTFGSASNVLLDSTSTLSYPIQDANSDWSYWRGYLALSNNASSTDGLQVGASLQDSTNAGVFNTHTVGVVTQGDFAPEMSIAELLSRVAKLEKQIPVQPVTPKTYALSAIPKATKPKEKPAKPKIFCHHEKSRAHYTDERIKARFSAPNGAAEILEFYEEIEHSTVVGDKFWAHMVQTYPYFKEVQEVELKLVLFKMHVEIIESNKQPPAADD